MLNIDRPIVDHIGIAVVDAIKAVSWMTERLGLPVVHDETLSDPPVRLLYVDAGNVLLQFVQPTGPGRVASFLQQHGEGLHHLCLRVDDVREAASAIAPEGPGTAFVGGRGQVTCFLDIQPSGVLVELAGPPGAWPESATP
jgi:methylmalonyl-CoA/ethylmalonyl-CoA epimerase